MKSICVGRHVSIGKNLVDSIDYAKDIGCTFFQIFLGSPRSANRIKRSQEELLGFKKKLKENKMKMVIHGSYIINLCHPKTRSSYDSMIQCLVSDLKISSVFGSRCLGVIIHMGKNIPSDKLTEKEAIKNYVKSLKKILSITPENSNIILETGASQGNEICSDIEGLAIIYHLLTKEEQLRVKFCIDTCHIWSTGYDISTEKKVIKFFKEFNKEVNGEISCIHFNDSKKELGSCVDRHENIGQGYINNEGLIGVSKYAYKNNIPVVLETPFVNDKDAIKEIKKLIKWSIS